MRTYIAALLAVVTVSCDANEPISEKIEFLDPAHGQFVTSGCTGPGVPGAEGFFEATPEDVVTLEIRLAELFAEVSGDFESTAPMASPFEFADDPNLFRREYLGFHLDGRKFVFGNIVFAPEDEIDGTGPTCRDDGGPQVFGVQYDLGSGKIVRVDFSVGLSPPSYEPIIVE